MFRAMLFFALLIFIYLYCLVFIFPLAIHFTYYTSKAIFDRKHLYALQVFVSYDQFLNVLLAPILTWIFKDPLCEFGWADETISSVIGKNILRHPNQSDLSLYIVDRVLSKIDPKSDHHSIDSIENDEGSQS